MDQLHVIDTMLQAEDPKVASGGSGATLGSRQWWFPGEAGCGWSPGYKLG